MVQWISEESESVHLKFESNRKQNLKEYKPLRKVSYSHGILFISTIKFIISLCRRCQRDAEAKAVKRQSPSVRQKEAEAKVAKRQSPSVRQKEAEAMAAKRQSPIV